MKLDRRGFSALTLATLLQPVAARAQSRAALVIARGDASGDWPEGTRGAYELAIAQGADFIETGVVSTLDGALVARRDNDLSTTTDVAVRPEFADRRATHTIGSEVVEGWFVERFTLAELKTLNSGAPIPGKRKSQGSPVLTFKEVVDIARGGSVRAARVIGVDAHLVRPAYFASINLALEPRLAEIIRANGYDAPAAAMMVGSFEATALKAIGRHSRVRRVQFIRREGGPADNPNLRYADMISAEGLQTVRSYAEGLGPQADLILSPGSPQAPPLVTIAHGAGLSVHAWTDDVTPPSPFRRGDARGYFKALFAAGIDGLASDAVAVAVKARAEVRSQS